MAHLFRKQTLLFAWSLVLLLKINRGQGEGNRSLHTVGYVRSYPVLWHVTLVLLLQGGFIWLFYGSDALPVDERPPIPFVEELEDPSWKPVYGEIEFECNHWSVFENAIDMAHIHYLHNDTFGNQVQLIRNNKAFINRPVTIGKCLISMTPGVMAFLISILCSGTGTAPNQRHVLLNRCLRRPCRLPPAQQTSECHVGVLQGTPLLNFAMGNFLQMAWELNVS